MDTRISTNSSLIWILTTISFIKNIKLILCKNQRVQYGNTYISTCDPRDLLFRLPNRPLLDQDCWTISRNLGVEWDDEITYNIWDEICNGHKKK